jgi:hypothetical protein
VRCLYAEHAGPSHANVRRTETARGPGVNEAVVTTLAERP